jgi:ankyrin repeat protein
LPTTKPHAMDLEPCAHCGAPDAPNVCSGCRAAHYCSPQCQSANWRNHRPRCDYAIQRYQGIREDTRYEGISEPLVKAAAAAPAASVIPAALHALSPGERAHIVCALICALDVDRVTAAFRAGNKAGVRTTMRAGVGVDKETLLHWAAQNLNRGRKLHRDLHERALAVWETVVAAAPLSQLIGTDDFSIADTSESGDATVLRAPTGMTPLSFVCGFCNRLMASQAAGALLRRGVDASSRNPGGTFPLMLAAVFQTAAIVRQLLDAGAPALARLPGTLDSLLHVLARSECPAAAAKVRLLVDAGADMEAVNAKGLTPLFTAVVFKYGSLRAFDALVAAGARTTSLLEIEHFPQLEISINMLHIAVLYGNSLAVRHLTTTLPQGVFSALDVPVPTTAASPGAPALPGYRGATALHLAASSTASPKDSLLVVESLLRASSHLHARDAEGRTPLLRALAIQTLPAIVEALVGAGAVTNDADLAAAVAQAAASCITRKEGAALPDVPMPGGPPVSMSTLAKYSCRNLRLLCAECVRRGVPLPPSTVAAIPPGALAAPLLAALHELVF